MVLGTSQGDDDETVLITMDKRVLMGREEELKEFLDITEDHVRFELKMFEFPGKLMAFNR